MKSLTIAAALATALFLPSAAAAQSVPPSSPIAVPITQTVPDPADVPDPGATIGL